MPRQDAFASGGGGGGSARAGGGGGGSASGGTKKRTSDAFNAFDGIERHIDSASSSTLGGRKGSALKDATNTKGRSAKRGKSSAKASLPPAFPRTLIITILLACFYSMRWSLHMHIACSH